MRQGSFVLQNRQNAAGGAFWSFWAFDGPGHRAGRAFFTGPVPPEGPAAEKGAPPRPSAVGNRRALLKTFLNFFRCRRNASCSGPPDLPKFRPVFSKQRVLFGKAKTQSSEHQAAGGACLRQPGAVSLYHKACPPPRTGRKGSINNFQREKEKNSPQKENSFTMLTFFSSCVTLLPVKTAYRHMKFSEERQTTACLPKE